MAKKPNTTDKRRARSTFMYDGRRYEETGRTQKEADQKAALKKEQLKRGETGISGSMTVSRWAHEWLETYKRPAIGDAHYKNYLLHIDGVILPAIGSMKLKSVTAVHLQQIINNRAGKSKSDILKLRMTIKEIFKRARLSRLITYDPAEDLTIPAATDGKRRSITPTERKHILAVADTHNAGLWVKTLLYTGIRPGESRALDWRHIDFKKKLLHVEQAMKAGTKTIGAPKTEAGVRDIPIPDKLYTELLAAKGEPFSPVFVQSKTGKRHTTESMQTMWLNFRNELDIHMGAVFQKRKAKDGKMRLTKTVSAIASDLVPYCLRHTYCTDLQDAGVPINVAKYLMGHSSIEVTAKIYTHTTEKVLKDTAKKINAAM